MMRAATTTGVAAPKVDASAKALIAMTAAHGPQKRPIAASAASSSCVRQSTQQYKSKLPCPESVDPAPVVSPDFEPDVPDEPANGAGNLKTLLLTRMRPMRLGSLSTG